MLHAAVPAAGLIPSWSFPAPCSIPRSAGSASNRILKKLGNFPSGRGKIVATHGGALFQQMIGIAKFLAGNRFNERHGKMPRESF